MITTPASQMAAADACAFEPLPYCFGLETSLCDQFPQRVHFGGAPTSAMTMITGGFDICPRRWCESVTNALCFTGIAALLLVTLAIALYGLISNA